MSKNKCASPFRLSRLDLFAYAVFFLVLTVFLYLSRLGSPTNDELTYVAGVYRLLNGDSLVADEWNPAQFYSVFLALPMKLYILFNGSTEGIFLAGRIFYVSTQTALGLLFYHKLKKYGFVSIFASVSLVFFAPVLNSSYNTLLLDFTVLFGLIIISDSIAFTLRFFIAGIFFSCAVLCDPVTAVLFFAYTFAVICCFFIIRSQNKKKLASDNAGKIPEWLSIKVYLPMLSGVLLSALVFIIYLCVSGDIREIIRMIPILLSFFGNRNFFPKFGALLIFLKPYTIYLIAFAFLLFAAVAAQKRRKMPAARFLYVCLCILTAVLTLLIIRRQSEYYMFVCLPVTILGLISYILTKERNKSVFFFLWIPGIADAAVRYISSVINNYMVLAMLVLPAAAGLFFIRDCTCELFSENSAEEAPERQRHRMKTVAVVLTAAAIMLQLSVEFVKYIPGTKPYGTYITAGSPEDTVGTLLVSGPLKGIMTTEQSGAKYYTAMNDLSLINREYAGKNLLIIENCAWGYLYTNCPCASLSVICPYEEFDILLKYYEVNPEKIPDCVYILTMLDYYASLPTSSSDRMAARVNLKKYFDFFNEHFTCENVSQSDCGYIIALSNFHAD